MDPPLGFNRPGYWSVANFLGWNDGANEMNAIKLYKLEREDVLSHFLSVIDADGLRLSSKVLGYLDHGDFYVLAPIGLAYKRLKDFAEGQILAQGPLSEIGGRRVMKVDSLADSASELTHQLLRDAFQATAFIREPYLRQEDNSDIVDSLVPIDSALYEIVPLSKIDAPALTKLINRFQVSWSFLMIIADVDLEERDIAEVLNRAAAIAVNAYDGESFVWWIRSGIDISRTEFSHAAEL